MGVVQSNRQTVDGDGACMLRQTVISYTHVPLLSVCLADETAFFGGHSPVFPGLTLMLKKGRHVSVYGIQA